MADSGPSPPTVPVDADDTLLAVCGVTLLAVAARLVALGGRVMHWDEGRVGYWALRYHETGEFYYRPIVHGPFLQIVDGAVFSVLSPTAFSARLVVAVIGGLLPLAALLLRHRLRDTETVALAVILAANPLLVYYSRFMRSDVPVGAFAFVAFAFGVRAVDRRRLRDAYLAVVALALAFTAKENALVYLLCFLGAAALVVDGRLVARTADGESVPVVVEGWLAAAAARCRAWGGSVERGLVLALAHAGGLVAAFLLVVAFFYAPRPALWEAVAAPTELPDVASDAVVGSATRFAGTWIGGTHQAHPYVSFAYDYGETLVFGAPGVLVLAPLGAVIAGYGPGDRARSDLVAFATYWGLASLVGYPAATDIRAPWAAVHAVLPLAIPAAVGLAAVYRRADLSVPDRDALGPWVRGTLAALVLVAAVGGLAGLNATYTNSTSTDHQEVLQYAQPANDLQVSLRAAERAIDATDDGPDPDVLYYGTKNSRGRTLLYVRDESSADQPRVGGPNWHSRLPLPWYFEAYGAEVTSTAPDAGLPSDPPPVVVARSWDRAELESELSGYAVREHRFRLWGPRIVVFVDRSAG